MARFNLSEYQTVEDRLREFLTDYPDGRVITHLEEFDKGDGNKDKGRFIVKSAIFLNGDELLANKIKATGYAEEIVGQGMVNGTSALENCETSAIGRALANAGYAPKGKRPSQEEMVKVASRNAKPSSEPLITAEQAESLRKLATDNGKDGDVVYEFAITQPASQISVLEERIKNG